MNPSSERDTGARMKWKSTVRVGDNAIETIEWRESYEFA